jgi:hypothetical protein
MKLPAPKFYFFNFKYASTASSTDIELLLREPAGAQVLWLRLNSWAATK